MLLSFSLFCILTFIHIGRASKRPHKVRKTGGSDGNNSIEAVSSCTLTFFFLHPHNFVNSKTDPIISGSESVLRIHQSGSESCCIRNEGAFRKQSLYKLLISRLLNSEAYFLLRIGGSGMIFFNYGFLNPESIFWIWIGGSGMIFSIMKVLHFLFTINTIIHVLPEASIWEITGCANLKIYRIS